MPDAARLDDQAVRAAVAAAPDGRPVLGLGPGGRPVALDLDGADRHLAIEAHGAEGPMILRALAAQLLRHGARVTILGGHWPGRAPFGGPRPPDAGDDAGQLWAHGLPGVAFHPGPEAAHDALVRIDADTRRGPAGTRHAVLVQDLGLRALVERWWWLRHPREVLRRPPGLRALDRLLTSPDRRRLHLVWVTYLAGHQRALVSDRRVRAMARQVLVRAEPAMWAVAAPEAWPPPPLVLRRGRAHLIGDDGPLEVQLLDIRPEEARRWATGG